MHREFLVVIVAFLLLGSCASVAYADLYKGYEYNTKQITMSTIDNPWTIRITTNNPNVAQVTVNWYHDYFLTGDLFAKHVVTGSSPFEDTIIPDKSGVWFVTFEFQDKNGRDFYSVSHEETIDDFYLPGNFVHIQNVVPEVPLLGTVGVVAAMLLGFAVYKKRKN